MTRDMLLKRIQKYIDGHDSKTKAAAALGISAQYLHDVMQGRREPGPKLLRALGVERVPHYKESRADA